jgi:UDP-N-acetyl-D-glucosamine dehydrogenase
MSHETVESVGIIGMGYVGLPLAVAAARAGSKVFGVDLDPSVVARLNQGISHIDDVSHADVQEISEMGFRATQNFSELRDARVIVICVPTPLTVSGGPDLSAVEGAGRAISENLQMGQLVVLESTTYPGTTEEILIPILESSGLVAGKDFHCAYSPERIDPGNATFGIRNTPKVVGGLTPACLSAASNFYERFVTRVVQAKGLREAEMSKILENTFRQVNIALVNEMAQFAHSLDIDLWNVIECAESKPFGFQPFFPGPGVGGHCIPIDPKYLSHRVQTTLGRQFRMIELAQEINQGMPEYVVRRIQDLLNLRQLSIKNAKILLLGVTYKKNISDQRESPAIDIGHRLLASEADLRFHDPYVESWKLSGVLLRRVESLATEISESDLVVILQDHDEYLELPTLFASKDFFDTRGSSSGTNVASL